MGRSIQGCNYHVHNPLPQMQILVTLHAGVPDKKGFTLKLPHGYVQEMKIRLRTENWGGCGSKWLWHYSYISLGGGGGWKNFTKLNLDSWSSSWESSGILNRNDCYKKWVSAFHLDTVKDDETWITNSMGKSPWDINSDSGSQVLSPLLRNS
jgi:hypothetical protein